MNENTKTGLIGLGLVMIILAIIVAVFGGLHYISHNHAKPGLWWNEYHASMDKYNVVIDEGQNEGDKVPHRIVHITTMSHSFYGVTGHDYNMDGKWDRVFFCGYPYTTNGCNSYVWTGKNWRWEPCEGDKGMVPIATSEITNAIVLLNNAMTNRTIDKISVVWTYNSYTYLHRNVN